MRRSHTKLPQYDLFVGLENNPVTVPQWHNLPDPMRHQVTSLMARLLMEHGPEESNIPEESNEPAANVVDPLLIGEVGDV